VSDPGLLVGGAVTLAGLATVTVGLAGSSVQRRRESAISYLDALERDDAVVDLRSEQEEPSLFESRLAEPFVARIIRPSAARLVGWVSSVTPADHRARVRARLAAAGLDFRRRPEEVIAVQGIGAVLGLALGLLLWASTDLPGVLAIGLGAVLALAGAATPMLWLSRQVDDRTRAIRADLPDTLDLLAISVEAGVGLEGAFEVVTERFSSPLSDEVTRMLQEMGLGLSRRDALLNLKSRAQVPELSSFVGALIQADTLGMPLGHVLKVQAGEMRSKRRQWARERAAKLPVKILFPLVMCIFPAVLVVVLGPAMSQIGQALK
jgi:tight adherence protein C